MKPGRLVVGVIVLLVLGVFFSSFFLGTPVSLVAWGDLRGIAIESDDWGLAGFIPSANALEGLDRSLLGPGCFPPVYWGSTLEDSGMVSGVASILARVKGRDGLPAVFQPNYVLGSLAWIEQGGQWTWQRFYWPDFSASYRRPGLVSAVNQAISKGVWHPEYHAIFHYEAARRMAAVDTSEVAALAARRGVMLFPGSERAWELAPGRPLEDLRNELDTALEVFQNAFGRPVGSVIAPDYTWDSREERMWLDHGLRVIQAKREQRFPDRGWGFGPRLRKVWQQRWERYIHRDRYYLERNCRFEPVQSPDPEAVIQHCAEEVRRAWQNGEPAIIEAHRINFVHTDPSVVQEGRQAFFKLLENIKGTPGSAPMFLVDSEIASLSRNGISVCQRGENQVVRNMTWSGRMVAVGGGFAEVQMCWLPARSVAVLAAGSSTPKIFQRLHQN